uniref:Condensin complex subunit 2 n=1 Tax=Cacopsylla melanoneura TaxID=428564 RepID=A0A8D9EWN7_9HEMI
MATSKRKSLKSIEASLNSETFESTNDDEAERSRYRKQLEDQAREGSPAVSVRSAASSVGGAPGPSILETFTAKQLNDHFTSCIKLSAENKINVKNAFDLQLIDYMTLMLKKKDSIMNDFSIASTTLDASAKIYGCRVDSLFQNIVSIANSLSTNKQSGRGRGEEDEGEEGEEGEEEEEENNCGRGEGR